MPIAAEQINRLLPQTQCRECGYDGCLPYARALAAGEAAVNLCAPGGETVMLDIAGLLGKPPLAPAKTQAKALARIDESACIGCTACIRACPVDAIMGASKFMHTVIAEECTGCGLCVAPCPVDCIHMLPNSADHLPQSRGLSGGETAPRFAAAAHAQARFERRENRKAREEAEKKARRAEREAAALSAKAAARQPNPAKPAFNPADLIAQAMARANARQTQRSVPSNREHFKQAQIKAAQEKAAFRRYQRDAQYGSETEKAAAIAWLRQYKEAQGQADKA
ncbi:MAG: RnfABCDGE type electron transport complex subunit B [Neisseria sp.]|nr:RnfABCDGE type electron transport complex subunit B [Neisseria sp.]